MSGSAPSDTATLLTVFGTFTLVCAALISGIVYLVGRLAALNRTSAVYTLSDDGIRRDVGGRVDSLSFTEITEVRVWRNQGQRIRVMRIKGASLFSRWYVTDLEDMDAFAAALGERVPQSTIVSKRLYLDLGEPRNQVLFLAAIALAMAAYVIIRSRVG
ncbi:MAG TPA: hypothetical protein VMV50_02890 [Candidatus Paceibacterota bacterium]|nr:hypothetical protein [Candidatus Paceibacterota bacterium]